MAAALASLAFGGGFAHADAIDDLVAKRLGPMHLPGLSLAVVRGGRVIKSAGYGIANLEMGTAATEDTVYEIGSLTKQFTAVAILLLEEEGRLSLDDSVRVHFPEAPGSWQAITIRHLLTHTSGIQNHVALPEFMRALFRGESTGAELTTRFFALQLEFQPGETWAYDNTGYYLLGLIIEQVAGVDYWSFLAERILGPLGMHNTGPNDTTGAVPRVATGYGWEDGEFKRRPPLPPAVALSAGALRSTVGDMAIWESALFEGRLLSADNHRLMWTATRGDRDRALPVPYGLGWIVDTWGSEPLIQHSGGTPGFSSTHHLFPNRDLAVILLSNHGDRILDTLALDIAAIVDPGLRPAATNDPDPSESERLRSVFASLLEGTADSGDFTPEMNRFLGTTTGKGWFEWVGSHGSLDGFRYFESEETADGRLARYRVTLGDSEYWFRFLLDADGKVAQVNCW